MAYDIDFSGEIQRGFIAKKRFIIMQFEAQYYEKDTKGEEKERNILTE